MSEEAITIPTRRQLERDTATKDRIEMYPSAHPNEEMRKAYLRALQYVDTGSR